MIIEPKNTACTEKDEEAVVIVVSQVYHVFGHEYKKRDLIALYKTLKKVDDLCEEIGDEITSITIGAFIGDHKKIRATLRAVEKLNIFPPF